MMHHQMQFIFICSFLCATIAAPSNLIEIPKESLQKSTVELASDDVSSRSEVAGATFETSHKVPHHIEFQTSHKISQDGLQHREGLHQSMRSKEKPELDDQLGELIAADIKSNIEAKRLSEYEKYVIEPLTTEKPVLTTTEEGIAQSINEGLIDDFSILEEAGTENKQQSRIQIKKGPNGQDYEYEYVYYYYDDDEKNPEDSDVIIANKKSPSSTTTKATTQSPAAVSSGKASYASIERGSSNGERNEIQSRGKGRAQAIPAPVVEEITDDRLPPATRFPQRGKSSNAAPASSSENVAPETGKKHHPKRPSLELVDNESFNSGGDKNAQKGPRIIEIEHSKTESLESVSKASIEYSSSTIEPPSNNIDDEEEEEDTTPSMEKATFDLYAHIANENANEEEKKITSEEDLEATTIENEDQTTVQEEEEEISSSTSTTTTTTTTTTPEPTTTTTTTTTEAPTEAPRGRGAFAPGNRKPNRFNAQPRTTTTTEASAEPTEAPKTGKNRFSKPSFSARGGNARTTKTTVAPVEEAVEKAEAPQQQSSTGSKFRGGARNRFNIRNNAPASPTSTEKPAANSNSNNEVESTTASRLVRPRPQFSLRNRGRAGPTSVSTEAPAQTNTETSVENKNQENEDKSVEKSSAAPIVPRPTSRLNINRPGNRVVPAAGQKNRPSPLNRSRVNSNVENNDDNKSANENESDAESTTANNLNKIKSRPRIQINAESKAKKTTAQPAINRKANPLISKRKFGVTSTTEASVDEADENESDNATKEGAKDESANELKEEETTQAAEVTSEQPRGIGLLNRRKLVANNRRPGTIN